VQVQCTLALNVNVLCRVRGRLPVGTDGRVLLQPGYGAYAELAGEGLTGAHTCERLCWVSVLSFAVVMAFDIHLPSCAAAYRELRVLHVWQNPNIMEGEVLSVVCSSSGAVCREPVGSCLGSERFWPEGLVMCPVCFQTHTPC
jgi:hypothetical protein